MQLAGVAPEEMSIAIAPAIRKVMKHHALAMSDVDLWELHEAYAVTTLYNQAQLETPWEITNVNGGAVPLGHPYGMSGIRYLGSTLLELGRRKAAARRRRCLHGGRDGDGSVSRAAVDSPGRARCSSGSVVPRTRSRGDPRPETAPAADGYSPVMRPLPLALVVLVALGACHRDKATPDPAASGSASSPPAPAASVPVAAPRVVADHAGRALVASGDAGTPLRIFLRREGHDVWAFEQPGATLLRMRGTVGSDESVIFAGRGPKADSLELRPRADGTVELRSSMPDGGVARVVSLADGVGFRADQAKFDIGFTLRLGDIPARAQIRSDHGAVSGYYRYARSETDLALAGTVDASGHFEIAERTSGAVVTGRWSGVFLGSEAAAGVWSSADGKRELPLTMRSAPPLAALVVPDGGPGVLATIEEKSEERPAGHGCTNTLTWSNVLGLVPAARNKLVNDHIRTLLSQQDTVQCDGSEQMLPWFTNIGVTVESQAPGYMGISFGEGSYRGGAHPFSSASCELVDTHTGEAVSLLGVLGPAALDKLGDQVTGQYRQWLKDVAGFGDGTESAPVSEGELCYVDSHHLEARYAQGSIGPWFAGPFTASVDVDPWLPLVPKSPPRDALFAARGD